VKAMSVPVPLATWRPFGFSTLQEMSSGSLSGSDAEMLAAT